MPTDKILAELVLRTAEHFNLEPQDALAAVAMSRLANELCEKGESHEVSLDALSSQLFYEISRGI